MRYLGIFAAIAVCLAVSATAQAEATFQFDPVNFYNWSAPTDQTRGLNGGMFRLHEMWGSGMINSWQTAGNATLNTWKAGLGEFEGICSFNIWLADQANAPGWGETLISSGASMPTATASGGWTAQVIGNPWPDGGDGYWLVQWYTTDPTKYIRPGNDPGVFSFSFDPVAGTPVTAGQDYTIWFGGVNYGTSTVPGDQGILFDNSWGGFASNQVADTYSTGFEATLSLEAVPEPVTMAGLMLGIGGIAGYVRRRRAV